MSAKAYSLWDRIKWRLGAWDRPPQTAGWSLEKRDAFIESLMNPLTPCHYCPAIVKLDDLSSHFDACIPKHTPQP